MHAELRLPLPPSMNHYWQHTVLGSGKKARVSTFISKDGRAYKDKVKLYLKVGRFPHFGSARLQVDVIVHFSDARQSDVDNRLKPLLDALSDELESAKDAKKHEHVMPGRLVQRKGLWRDDSQVDDLRISRGAPVKGGAVVVYVQAVGQAPLAEQPDLLAA